MGLLRRCRSRTRRITLIVLGAFLSSACVGLVLLRFGDPQWHRWIYMFQANVWPKYEHGQIDPPPGYSGRWTRWHTNGMKLTEQTFKNGALHGKGTVWFYDGFKQGEGHYRNGLAHGRALGWYPNHQMFLSGSYRNGKQHGEWTFWKEDGTIDFVAQYEEGAKIRQW